MMASLAPITFRLSDGSPAMFIPKTEVEGNKHCCPLCDGVGTVRRLTIAHIVRVVSEHYRLDVEDLLSNRRHHEVSHPRQVAMYLARQLTNQSLPCIGRKFNRNHTTVIHAVREVEKRMFADGEFEREVENLMMEMMG